MIRFFIHSFIFFLQQMNNQHFFTKLANVVTYNPNNGFMELFGHLYKTINSSAASVNGCILFKFGHFSIIVIILNEQFINVILLIYIKYKDITYTIINHKK